jgi:hypothetical protein
MVNENVTEMEIEIVTWTQNEILHWTLMETWIWNAGPHLQMPNQISAPAKKQRFWLCMNICKYEWAD